MKNKKEILEHLKERGYTKEAVLLITGFLVGKEVITMDEEIVVRNGKFDADDFIEWYESNDDFSAAFEEFMSIIDNYLNEFDKKSDDDSHEKTPATKKEVIRIKFSNLV